MPSSAPSVSRWQGRLLGGLPLRATNVQHWALRRENAVRGSDGLTGVLKVSTPIKFGVRKIAPCWGGARAPTCRKRPNPRQKREMNKRPLLRRQKRDRSDRHWVVAAELTPLQRQSHRRGQRNDQPGDTWIEGQCESERSGPRAVRISNPEQETPDGEKGRKRNDQRHRRLN